MSSDCAPRSGSSSSSTTAADGLELSDIWALDLALPQQQLSWQRVNMDPHPIGNSVTSVPVSLCVCQPLSLLASISVSLWDWHPLGLTASQPLYRVGRGKLRARTQCCVSGSTNTIFRRKTSFSRTRVWKVSNMAYRPRSMGERVFVRCFRAFSIHIYTPAL